MAGSLVPVKVQKDSHRWNQKRPGMPSRPSWLARGEKMQRINTDHFSPHSANMRLIWSPFDRSWRLRMGIASLAPLITHNLDLYWNQGRIQYTHIHQPFTCDALLRPGYQAHSIERVDDENRKTLTVILLAVCFQSRFPFCNRCDDPRKSSHPVLLSCGAGLQWSAGPSRADTDHLQGESACTRCTADRKSCGPVPGSSDWR